MNVNPILLIVLVFFNLTPAFAQKTFSVEKIKSDLVFYKRKLEQIHPSLHLYCEKEVMDHYFDELSSSLTKPLSELEFYGIITLSSTIVQDGHTLILPSQKTIAFHNTHSQFLPWQLGVSNDGLYIKMNFSSRNDIPDGARIVKINARTSEQVLRSMFDRQVRDGKNLSYASWILDNYFREYYSYIFGCPDTFAIEYLKDGALIQTSVPALKKDSISYYRSKNYPTSNMPTEGISLKFDTENSYAVLTVKDFHDEVLKREYHQNFKQSIVRSFEELRTRETENLIIDLRNNQGGDVENGAFLLSYLLDRPFKVVNEYHRLRSGRLVKCKGPSSGIHQTVKEPFNGKLYVLVNGGSFSNSVIVASCLKTHNRAIFVGSETGGNPHVLAGYAREFELPNTKIRVEVPTKQFVMTSYAQNNGKGLVPDHVIHEDMNDHLLGIDRALKFVTDRVTEERKRP